MKVELGRCLLRDRLQEAGMSLDGLARALRYKPERLVDYAENKRVMPLKDAVSIAGTIGCGVPELYELKPLDNGPTQ